MAFTISFFYLTPQAMRFLFICTILSFVSISCTKDIGKVEPNKELLSGQIDTCSQNISFSKHIAPIINNSCALPTCHVPSGFKDFSTYSQLKTVIDAGSNYFISRIKPGGGMPPSYSTNPTPLTSCEVSKIESWIKDGYSNN